jgi:hypothetical protein
MIMTFRRCLLFLFIYFVCSIHESLYAQNQPKTIDLTRDFGAMPNDGKDDSKAFRQAMDYCRKHPGTILHIPSGDYHFKDEKAIEFEYKAINGQYGENVQGHFFKPNGEYCIALDMQGFRDIRVEAKGVTLVQEGWFEAISLTNAQNVSIHGLTLTHKRPPFTTGKIIQSTDSYFDVQIDTLLYPYLTSEITGRVHFYNPQTQRVYMGGGIKKKELLADRQTIRMYTDQRKPIGDYCILRHSAHNRAGILIKESEKIHLEDVTIHSQPGMGIIGHRSEDITLEGVQIIPQPGTFTSTNTDATHFTSCKGMIRFLNCKFGGQGDDCTNIHNYYWSVYPDKEANKVRITVEGADLHALSLDYPDQGDTLLLISKVNLNPVQTFIAKEIMISEQDWKVIVTLDKPLPIDLEHYYMINKTRQPSVQIYNNTVRSHLARAFLIKTSNVHMKGNVIQQSSGSAIQLGAEASWREGSPVENILIENNWFLDCGYGHGAQHGTVISAEVNGIQAATQTINRNIIIRNNVIQAVGKTAIYIADTDGVQIYRNQIQGAEKAVVVKNSTNILIDE